MNRSSSLSGNLSSNLSISPSPNPPIAVAGLVAGVALALCACGGGPHLESKTATERTYESTVRCGQGPIEAAFKGVGARWGESVEVRACGLHRIKGLIEVEVDGALRGVGPFGDGPRDNARCVVGEAELASRADTSSAEPAPASKPVGTASVSPAASGGATRAIVREIDAPVEVCPYAMTTQIMLDKVPKGADIRVKLWSDVPNDLDGALIRIRHVWHKPSVSEKEWIAHLEKEEAERAKRIREAEKREAERPKESPGKTPRIERVVTKRVSVPDGPPPPARVEVKPPQPSVHAEWVPGYWHWADLAAESERAESERSRWVWIRGMWRVPEADVAGGLTARAPRPPPTARYEERPPAPVAAAVWTPGYWQWDGGAFVWIEGAWRVAPSGRHRWRAPTWRASASGAIFVPGGWIHLGH